jgi:hypothetical protein
VRCRSKRGPSPARLAVERLWPEITTFCEWPTCRRLMVDCDHCFPLAKWTAKARHSIGSRSMISPACQGNRLCPLYALGSGVALIQGNGRTQAGPRPPHFLTALPSRALAYFGHFSLGILAFSNCTPPFWLCGSEMREVLISSPPVHFGSPLPRKIALEGVPELPTLVTPDAVFVRRDVWCSSSLLGHLSRGIDGVFEIDRV